MNEYTKDITKGDFGEPSFGGLAFQNKEGKTEILDENGNMVVITDENIEQYRHIFDPKGADPKAQYRESISFLPVSRYGSKSAKLAVAANLTICPYKVIGTRAVNPYEIMPLLEASGTYVRVGITGPTLTGNNNMRFTIQYWSSGSTVWNDDGQDIKGWRKWEGQAWTAQVLGTLWGGDLGKYLSGSRWSYTYNVGFQSTWMQIEAETTDRAGDSRFYATTGAITCYKGTYSCSNIGQYVERNAIRLLFRAYHGEDLCHQNFDSNGTAYWTVKALPTTDKNGTTYDFDCTMPKNFAGTMTYGLIPSGGNTSSPWAWSSATINVQTIFSSMSMPTVSASRDSTDPTKVTISWTAGGTTNKPKGTASRRPVLVLRRADGTNVATLYDKSIETAGSHTFTGVPTDIEISAFAEYSVSGLQGGTHYQKSNIVTVPAAAAKPKVKVNGAYKDVTNTYIKVNGAYKQVTEIYVKVNGAYKKIVK